MMNKWFSRYLYDVDNGVEKDPRAWIVRESAQRDAPTPYPEYPNPEAKHVTLFPTGDGRSVGGLASSKPKSAPKETLIDDVQFTGAQLAQSATSPNRLLYATAPLSAPVHLSGYSTVTLRLASSKPAANLSVWMVELTSGEGPTTMTLITRGWADPQNHASLKLKPGESYLSTRRGTPLKPGEFVDVTFNLQPDDQIIPVGKRIALMIMSSDRDFTLWPAAGTELTVDLGRSSVSLPVVGGSAAWRVATAAK
jgi:X-Pro dipeptidyl-peptidase